MVVTLAPPLKCTAVGEESIRRPRQSPPTVSQHPGVLVDGDRGEMPTHVDHLRLLRERIDLVHVAALVAYPDRAQPDRDPAGVPSHGDRVADDPASTDGDHVVPAGLQQPHVLVVRRHPEDAAREPGRIGSLERPGIHSGECAVRDVQYPEPTGAEHGFIDESTHICARHDFPGLGIELDESSVGERHPHGPPAYSEVVGQHVRRDRDVGELFVGGWIPSEDHGVIAVEISADPDRSISELDPGVGARIAVRLHAHPIGDHVTGA
jgi:hypothetical protein